MKPIRISDPRSGRIRAGPPESRRGSIVRRHIQATRLRGPCRLALPASRSWSPFEFERPARLVGPLPSPRADMRPPRLAKHEAIHRIPVRPLFGVHGEAMARRRTLKCPFSLTIKRSGRSDNRS